MRKTKFQFQLDVSQRTKLIEILLIVGSIVAAFYKIPPGWLLFFIVFVLLAIWYYMRKTKFQFQLDVSQRTKLIEILLIVGSIVAAFYKIPPGWLLFFIVFVLLAIWYYIYIINIKNEKKRNNISNENNISLFFLITTFSLSACFVGIVTYIFAISLKAYLKDVASWFGPGVVCGVVSGLSIIYWFVFTYVIYKALGPSNQSTTEHHEH